MFRSLRWFNLRLSQFTSDKATLAAIRNYLILQFHFTKAKLQRGERGAETISIHSRFLLVRQAEEESGRAGRKERENAHGGPL